MIYYQRMTSEGYQEIRDEIARLRKDRSCRIKISQETRNIGDLSESSEHTIVKMESGHLQSRLCYLDKQLRYLETTQKDESGTINLGSNVRLLFEGDDDVGECRTVGRVETDLARGKIFFGFPLGQALMKQEVGVAITVQTPAGSYDVKIIAVN